jgi:hypothetical protein
MKMKSFAVLALSGLLTASFVYVAPAMAQDMNNNGSTMQAPSDNTGNSSAAGMSQGNGSEQGAASATDQNGTNGSNGTNPGSTDQGSPDTATGDDDY